MTDNMLFPARADHADTMIEPAWLDVDAEFARMADYFEGLAEERQLTIACAGSGRVWGDAMLLRRALANLLANAVHYADASSSSQSSGLGLAIVQSIMALHKGKAEVFSVDGINRFTLTFPAPESVFRAVTSQV